MNFSFFFKSNRKICIILAVVALTENMMYKTACPQRKALPGQRDPEFRVPVYCTSTSRPRHGGSKLPNRKFSPGHIFRQCVLAIVKNFYFIHSGISEFRSLLIQFSQLCRGLYTLFLCSLFCCQTLMIIMIMRGTPKKKLTAFKDSSFGSSSTHT